MSTFVFADAAQTIERRHSRARSALRPPVLANLAMTAAFLAATGLVLFALHSALNAN